MSTAKPAEPQATPAGQPSTPQWLFLFYKWATSALAGLFPGTAGNVIYSDGAGGVANEDAFNYNAAGNLLTVVNIDATDIDVAGDITAVNTALTGYLSLTELADPGYATANQAWLHAEAVAGITQIHHNTATHKWTVGQDNWIVARNVTGGSIPALRAVYISGSTGSRPQITMADADLHQHAVGITQDTIADNGYGAVVMSGYVKGVDTSGWVAGDALYLGSTAGVMVTSAPAFPATKQRMATVIYSHATQGIIQVFHHEDVREADGSWNTPFSIGDGATAGEIRLLEPSGTQYTAFKAQAQAGNVTYILPAAHGTLGVLLNDGSGNLTWDTDISDLIDHGGLDGLADDDHTQYVLNDGTRATTVLAAASADYVRIGGGAAASELRFLEPSGGGTSYTGFKAPALAGNVMYTLPTADGTSGQVLSTNGSGTLAWATGGSGSDAAPMTPQGRLTLTTATPVMTAEAAAQTTIYYTPYVGSVVPLYDGSAWTNTQFAELSIAMAGNAAWASGSVYDLYVYNDGGTIRLVTGAAWTNTTTRSESLTRVNGIWTNAATMTGRYGTASTVSIAANRATYVGTFYASANGTTTWVLGGNDAAAFLYLWNCYNRVQVKVAPDEGGSSWSITSSTLASANGATTNRVTLLRGLNEDPGFLEIVSYSTAPSSDTNGYISCGLDSTSATAADAILTVSPALPTGGPHNTVYMGLPGLGLHFLQALNATAVNTKTSTFFGLNMRGLFWQ